MKQLSLFNEPPRIQSYTDSKRGLHLKLFQLNQDYILQYEYSKLIKTVLNHLPHEYIQDFKECKLYKDYDKAKSIMDHIIKHHKKYKPVEDWREI